MSVERDFGPVTFVIYVPKNIAGVDVDVKPSGRSISRYTLTPKATAASFDLINGEVSLRARPGTERYT